MKNLFWIALGIGIIILISQKKNVDKETNADYNPNDANPVEPYPNDGVDQGTHPYTPIIPTDNAQPNVPGNDNLTPGERTTPGTAIKTRVNVAGYGYKVMQ